MANRNEAFLRFLEAHSQVPVVLEKTAVGPAKAGRIVKSLWRKAQQAEKLGLNSTQWETRRAEALVHARQGGQRVLFTRRNGERVFGASTEGVAARAAAKAAPGPTYAAHSKLFQGQARRSLRATVPSHDGSVALNRIGQNAMLQGTRGQAIGLGGVGAAASSAWTGAKSVGRWAGNAAGAVGRGVKNAAAGTMNTAKNVFNRDMAYSRKSGWYSTANYNAATARKELAHSRKAEAAALKQQKLLERQMRKRDKAPQFTGAAPADGAAGAATGGGMSPWMVGGLGAAAGLGAGMLMSHSSSQGG